MISAPWKDARADKALLPDESETNEERNDTERHERKNLAEREPKLALSKFIHTEQIDDRHDESEEYCPPNCPDLGQE